jgi:proline dehydrogenase
VITLVRRIVLWMTGLPFVRHFVIEHPVGQRLAGRFVAGALLDHGMRAAHALHADGIAAMLDHLGENVRTPEQAAAATDQYIGALRRIRRAPELDCNISVKLTQLGLDEDVGLCMANMERVLEVAAGGPERPAILVMIDMESREYVDPTLEVYLKLREQHPNVGVCLQAYLLRTAEDAHRIGGPRAIVRMAKGAYLEPPNVAYRSKREVTKNYARLAATLLAGGATVHFATHDPALLEGARSFVRRAGIPRERYEFQMLYGIRRDLQERLVQASEPMRVYVPYGTQWYPYLTRRLAERPANIWFFASNALRMRG